VTNILADSGVITAFLNEQDQWHKPVKDIFLRLPKPFITCEAVITEVCYLLRSTFIGEKAVLDFVANNVLRLDFSLSEEVGRVMSLMKKYEDFPMSLADACLVRMSELYTDSAVFTIDSDFQVYRRDRNKSVPYIDPRQ